MTHCEVTSGTIKWCSRAQRREPGSWKNRANDIFPMWGSGNRPALRFVTLCLEDGHGLENCYPKHGPWTSSIGNPWQLVRNTVSGLIQTYWISTCSLAKFPDSGVPVAVPSQLDVLWPFTLWPLDALYHSHCWIPRPGLLYILLLLGLLSPCLLRVVCVGSHLPTPPEEHKVCQVTSGSAQPLAQRP